VALYLPITLLIVMFITSAFSNLLGLLLSSQALLLTPNGLFVLRLKERRVLGLLLQLRKKAVPADQACTKCGGRAYPAESVKMEGQLWHENCMRCVETGCGKKLNGSNWGGFVAPNNSPYCSVHLKRLVQSAGNSLEISGSTTGSKWNQSSQAPQNTSSSGDSGAGDSEPRDEPVGEGGEEEGSEPVSRPAEGTHQATSSPSPSAGGKPRWGGAPTEKCVKCGKTVYSAEMAKMEGQIWHDNCLRCVEEGCNKKLSGSNWGGFVPPNNAPYCKVHHQRLLQSSGSSIAFSGSTTASKWKINSGQ